MYKERGEKQSLRNPSSVYYGLLRSGHEVYYVVGIVGDDAKACFVIDGLPRLCGIVRR
jgi:hypothetical protein